MRWLLLAIITVLAAVLQTTVAAWMPGGQQTPPSFLFIVAMFYALRWPPVEAGIAGWVLGLAGDLTSEVSIGAQSLAFALAAVVASKARRMVNIQSPLVQLALTGLLCGITYAAVFGYDAWRSAWTARSFGRSVSAAAWIAVYTALLAPYLFWLLERMLVLLGLQVHRRR